MTFINELSISTREYWARTLKLFRGGEMTSSLGKEDVVVDLQILIDSRLESALHCPSTPPVAVIVVGPIAAGKTTHRKTRLGSGYVHIDSADIFHELSRGDATLDFPDAFASEIEHIGRALTKAAIDQKLSVAVETPGHDQDEIITLVNSLKKVGYQVEVEALATDRETCEAQHATRGDNVSSYWAAPIHVNWVVQECLAQAAA